MNLQVLVLHLEIAEHRERKQRNGADDAQRNVDAVVRQVRTLASNIELELLVFDVENDSVQTCIKIQAPGENARSWQIDACPRDRLQERIGSCIEANDGYARPNKNRVQQPSYKTSTI